MNLDAFAIAIDAIVAIAAIDTIATTTVAVVVMNRIVHYS